MLESSAGTEESLSTNYVTATRLGAAPENTRLREIVIDFAPDASGAEFYRIFGKKP